jgi:hypothetical protein
MLEPEHGGAGRLLPHYFVMRTRQVWLEEVFGAVFRLFLVMLINRLQEDLR